MLIIDSPDHLADHVGTTIGPGDWLTVNQNMIDSFAEITGDRQWIHVDVARAAHEMPDGKTIAHGFLLLSLLGTLLPTLYDVRGASRILNYGSDRLRFVTAVPSGARVRARVLFKSVQAITNGYKCVVETTMEVEGISRPALVAESIFMYYE